MMMSAEETLSSTVVIVVDAVDECGQEDHRQEILNVLSVECAKLPSFVKIFMTSRMEKDITDAFQRLQPWRLLDPKERDNVQDLEVKAGAMLKGLNLELGPRELASLRDTMVEKSAGVFVWLTVAESYLSRASDGREMLRLLENLPSDVNFLYKATLRNAFDSYPVIMEVVRTVIVGQEPLSTRAIADLLRLPHDDVKIALNQVTGIIKNDEAVKVRHKSLTDHITCADADLDSLFPLLQTFLATKLLDWFEALSVLEKVEAVIPKLFFQEWERLAYDAWRFLREFKVPITLSAAHVRWSALPFCPDQTQLSISYRQKPENQQLPIVIKGLDSHWSRCLQTLEGHTDHVNAVTISRDGKRIVTGSDDQTARVWNMESGRLVSTLYGHKGFVTSVAVGGSCIVTGSDDKTTKVWDLHTGKLLRTLIVDGYGTSVVGVAINSDGRHIVTVGDWTGRVWSMESGEIVQLLKGHRDQITSVATCGVGNRAVTGSHDGSAKVWEINNGRLVMTLNGHSNYVTSVAVNSRGSCIATGSDDGSVKIWNMNDGGLLRTLRHSYLVHSIAISDDGSFIATGARDWVSRIWDLRTGQVVKTLDGHRGGVTSVAMTSDGNRLLTASSDWAAKVWDLGSGTFEKSQRVLEGHNGHVTSVAVSEDGELIITGSSDKSAKIWDAGSGKLVLTLDGHEDSVESVTISRPFVVTGSADRTARVWDSVTGKLHRQMGRDGSVNVGRFRKSIAFSTQSRAKTGKLQEEMKEQGCIWDYLPIGTWSGKRRDFTNADTSRKAVQSKQKGKAGCKVGVIWLDGFLLSTEEQLD
ncbi:POC1 centriolar protein A [Rhizophlyctis rosea]|nr:POC1 centriolar protein A [Rhizophlyctis rosea]